MSKITLATPIKFIGTQLSFKPSDPALPTLETVDNKAKEPNNDGSILASVKNAVLEGWEATCFYGHGFFSSLKSLNSGAGALFATAKALANAGKMGVDLARFGANTLYYRDKEAAEAATKDGDKSFSLCCEEMDVACQKTKSALSSAYDATSSTVNGLSHSIDSLYYTGDAIAKAGDATVKTIAACYTLLPAYEEIEVACQKTKSALSSAYDATSSTVNGLSRSMYYTGDATVKTVAACCGMLPAYHARIANNARSRVTMAGQELLTASCELAILNTRNLVS